MGTKMKKFLSFFTLKPKRTLKDTINELISGLESGKIKLRNNKGDNK